jgi:deoxycytidine triphosphate deaminase
MTVLSHQSIVRYCTTRTPLVTPFQEAQVKTAGYDLSLGNEYFLGSEGLKGSVIRVGLLDDDDPQPAPSGVLQWFARHLLPTPAPAPGPTPERRGKTVILPPNQVIIFTMKERVQLPRTLVGHLSLKLELLLKGLLMASQSQIDAGYEGPIYLLLYNLSDKEVSLSVGQEALRLEFEEVDQATDVAYKGRYSQTESLQEALLTPVNSSLSHMNAKVEENERYVSSLKRSGLAALVVGLAAVLVASAAGIVPVVVYAAGADASAKASELEVQRLDQTLGQYEHTVIQLQAEVRVAQEQMQERTRAGG